MLVSSLSVYVSILRHTSSDFSVPYTVQLILREGGLTELKPTSPDQNTRQTDFNSAMCGKIHKEDVNDGSPFGDHRILSNKVSPREIAAV